MMSSDDAAAESAVSQQDENDQPQTDGENGGERPRRRVRLNPTIGAERARAVPTIETAAPPPPQTPPVPSPAPLPTVPTAEAEGEPQDRPPERAPAETAEAAAETESAVPEPAEAESAVRESAVMETTTAEPAEAQTAEPISAGSEAAAAEPVAPLSAPPPPRPSAQPVEIPRAAEQLDAETEAEIVAALSGGELETAPPVPEPSVADSEQAPEKPEAEEDLEPGAHLTGKIQQVHGEDVFLDVGYRSPGVAPMRQFAAGKKPEVGQIIEVVVERFDPDEGLILLNLPRGIRRATGNWESVAVGQTVDCMVLKTNKGGLEVNVGNLRGFMPASQVELGFVSDLEAFVGQKLTAQVTEVNPKKRKLIVSRRAHLMVERKEREEELWQTLSVGQTHDGTVKTIKDYGAFVDIGGVDGFLHIGEISHARIRHPRDILSEGQRIAVKVLSLDRDKKKIGLGMKQLIDDPWKAVTANYPAESTVTGRVTRIADFGAFVELEPGVEGLVHISEIDHARVRRVSDVLQEGQNVEARVLEVDPERNRISLSIKALKAKPASGRDEKAQPKPDPYERKRKGPLKGGTSDSLSASGGLFGNPKDFGG